MNHDDLTAGLVRSGAARPPLSPALEHAINELRDQVASPRAGPADHQHLSHITRRIVHQARADGLRAEQLVVAFRAIWNGLTGVPGHPEMRSERLVGALITTFYEDHATSDE